VANNDAERTSSTIRTASGGSARSSTSTSRRSRRRSCTTSWRTRTLSRRKRGVRPEIAQLVEGVTKLTDPLSREQAEAENYRKMIVATQDVRVILIAPGPAPQHADDRVPGKQKQVQKAKETLEVYAPLAHRLGIHALVGARDLSFQVLHPRVRGDQGDGRRPAR
jgi:hypothetical protein